MAQNKLEKRIQGDAERIEKIESEVKAKQENAIDSSTDEKVILIPTPNFTDAPSVGTMLPINMANEIVTNVSQIAKEIDLVDFVKEKLNYPTRISVARAFASEQIDALVLAIKSFEKRNGFILGDMAGIGKGRVCAGVLRYAYQQNIIPVFLTQQSYLFSDIYRDLVNIGGFGIDDKGKTIQPKPFVMHQDGVIRKKDNTILKTAQRIREKIVRKTDEETGEYTTTTEFHYVANNSIDSIQEICKSLTNRINRKGVINLGKDFNCVFLPYSVVSLSRKNTKRDFLKAIAPNSILVFDESHTAASGDSDSKILQTAIPLVEASKAVLFSSATYAKNAQVYNLYIIKTALRTAVPSLDSITDALKIGGENVSEFIASGLAKEGQYIRRDRNFGDCKIFTDYVGMRRGESAEGKLLYEPIANDNQVQFYDDAVEYFKELRDFSKSDLAKTAVMNAIERKVDQMRKNLADGNFYLDALNATDENTARQLQQRFISENRNKWLLTDFSVDSIARYKGTFRDNLFLAIKAKFTADKIIEALNTPVEYRNLDGTRHTAPLKPLIGIKNTGEQIFNELQLKEGDRLKNDFSVYLKAIYNKLFVGNFKLRKVNNNIFFSKRELVASDDWNDDDEIKAEYNVDMSDFSDNGEKILEIQSKLDAYNSSLPFSIIDYLRDRINSTNRSDIYYIDKNTKTPRYGNARSNKYEMAEATSRKKMLRRIGNTDMWEYVKNDRNTSTTEIFRAFNNGGVDVMLINVVASTGGSAQSSPEEGSDTRPRNMFIIQFEADINIEVQKRGRINRTGQINSPTYTYVISRIPVESRQYLMFRKKLRKLDANTSGNQTASSKSATLIDYEGKVVEDIFNAYGFDVFKKDFIELPQNADYKQIFDDLGFISTANRSAGEAEKNEANIENFNAFVRELELYPTDFQRVFFDQMQVAYKEEKEKKILTNEWQEELEAKNYKAKLKQRVVIQLNNGDTVFSNPLFMTDYFTLDNDIAWTKTRVNAKVNELLAPFKTTTEFHKFLLEDYQSEHRKMVQTLALAYDKRVPKPEFYATDEEYNNAMAAFQIKKRTYLNNLEEGYKRMIDYMRFFKPDTPVFFNNQLGKFVGYKLKDAGKFKYSDGSIDFIFCFLNKYPVIHLKKSSDEFTEKGLPSISEIKQQTEKLLNQEGSLKVAEWKPNIYERIVRRFLTGNILQGIVEANRLKYSGEIVSWALTRFYLVDGSVTTAVELKLEKELPMTTNILNDRRIELKVAASNVNMVSYLRDMQVSDMDSMNKSTREVQRYVHPVWNSENDVVIDRAMCFLKYDINGIPTLYVNVLQNYKTEKGTNNIQPPEKQWKNTSGRIGGGESRYNDIFYDSELNTKYKDFLFRENFRQQGIKYAFKPNGEYDDKGEQKGQYKSYNAYVNTFAFNLDTDEQILTEFLNDLYAKYQIYFNFKTSADVFSVAPQGDVPLEELKGTAVGKTKRIETFEKGAYNYRFTKSVSENLILSIPYLLQKTFDGGYGGVVLEQPLSPLQLPSYNLKPYKLPNEVYVKVTLASFSDEDKTLFVNELEEKSQTEDAYEIGVFVTDFIAKRTINPEYFFGNLTYEDYGLIFKEYGQKREIKNLLIEEKDIKIAKPKKNKVTFEDAENFLMYLL